VARDAAGGVGGAEKGEPRCLGGAPFVIPELETSDVELKAVPAKAQRDSFDQQLLLREGRVAGVTRLVTAWTAPNPSDAGMR
jgi:hypothetical protein